MKRKNKKNFFKFYDMNTFFDGMDLSLCLAFAPFISVYFFKEFDYKIDVLSFKCINGLAPESLSNLVEEYVPVRNLRSSSQKKLKQKVTNFKRLGDRSSAFSAPQVWNSLPFFYA